MINPPLDKLETAAALSAVQAVRRSMKDEAPHQIAEAVLGGANPLTKAESKLAMNLDRFNAGDVRDPADAWYTLYDYIEGEDDFTDEQLEAINVLSDFFINIEKEAT